ncbi:MAG: hypothetical protein WD468_12105 [Pirellulales bacterium]
MGAATNDCGATVVMAGVMYCCGMYCCGMAGAHIGWQAGAQGAATTGA